MDSIQAGSKVLYLWQTDKNIEANINQIKSIANVSVSAENCERIQMAAHPASSFNNIVLSSTENFPSDGILATILKLLKPQSRLIVLDATTEVDAIKTRLIFAGFVKVCLEGAIVFGEKPNYEVGSSAKLSFGKSSAPAAKAATAWKIDNDDEDIIDPDELLDEEDLIKPDPTSLRVCGTTGIRKACKDCSCGLADELNAENGIPSNAAPTQKSSCGSCYLGDAFRCASCPYLGMPAFKPGEKIQLNDNLMNADV